MSQWRASRECLASPMWRILSCTNRIETYGEALSKHAALQHPLLEACIMFKKLQAISYKSFKV